MNRALRRAKRERQPAGVGQATTVILLIDNYDSFVFNLARYFQRLGQRTEVVRNDAITPSDVGRLGPQAVVLSPGPCGPREAGSSLEIVRACWQRLPMLGICLGHQTIAAAFGARIVRAARPMHGRTSRVFHDGKGIYAGLPNPFGAGRYHSLVVDEATLPPDMQVSARTAEGVVLGLRHRERPVVGVQFHPESILSEVGYDLLARFLRLAGLRCRGPVPTMASELRRAAERPAGLPDQPVTF